MTADVFHRDIDRPDGPMSAVDSPRVVAIGEGMGTRGDAPRGAVLRGPAHGRSCRWPDDGRSSGRLRELLRRGRVGRHAQVLSSRLAEDDAPSRRRSSAVRRGGAGRPRARQPASGRAGRRDRGPLCSRWMRRRGCSVRWAACCRRRPSRLVLKADAVGRRGGGAGRRLPGQPDPVGIARPGRRRGTARRRSEAIMEADQVVIGPGFASTRASWPRRRSRNWPRRSPRRRPSGSSSATCGPQVPETDGYDVGRHVSALALHKIPVDRVLWDSTAGMELGVCGPPVSDARLTDPAGRVHDPGRLAEALSGLLG